MDFIYELIFLGLIDTTQNSKISRPIRIFAAIFVSIVFITAIIGLGIYVVVAVDQGIIKRLMSAFLLLALAGYYIYLLKAMTKTNKKVLNKDNV